MMNEYEITMDTGSEGWQVNDVWDATIMTSQSHNLRQETVRLGRLMGLLYVGCNVKTEGCLPSVSARHTNYGVQYDFLFTAMKD